MTIARSRVPDRRLARSVSTVHNPITRIWEIIQTGHPMLKDLGHISKEKDNLHSGYFRVNSLFRECVLMCSDVQFEQNTNFAHRTLKTWQNAV